MRKSAVGMVLLALAGAVLTPLAAQQQPGQEPEAGTRAREALLELPSDVVFIDSKTFDRQLRRLMQAEPETIAVDFALEPSPNELPERLDEWLHAVEKHGGSVEIQPSEPTRGLTSALVYLARVALQAVRQSSLYRAAKNYDATIYYSPSSGLVERVVFLRRSNPRHQDTVGAEAHENAWLILPEEAPELALSAEEWDQTVGGTRGPSLGPRVSVIKPTIEERQQGPTITATSPLSLEVQFEENRAPIDMTSLTVSARRKSFPPVKVNLTERIQRYVKGWAIFASGISIPKGKYLIELVIADEEGHETVEAFRLEVTPQ